MTMNNQVFRLYAMKSCLNIKKGMTKGTFISGWNQAINDSIDFLSNENTDEKLFFRMRQSKYGGSQYSPQEKNFSEKHYFAGYQNGMEMCNLLVTGKYRQLNFENIQKPISRR